MKCSADIFFADLFTEILIFFFADWRCGDNVEGANGLFNLIKFYFFTKTNILPKQFYLDDT